MDFKKYISEFLGTMFFVLIGCGSAIAYGFSSGWIAVALAFGLTAMAMSYCYGAVSGCHINPAISFAMFVAKKIDLKDFLLYIASQFLGGIVAAAVLLIFFRANSGLGANGYNTLSSWDLRWWQALIAEIIMTAILAMVFLAIQGRRHKMANGIVIGLTYTALYVFGIPLTNASLNPARSLGPAIFTGGMPIRHIWVFIVAPLIGALLASLGYMLYEKNYDAVRDEVM